MLYLMPLVIPENLPHRLIRFPAPAAAARKQPQLPRLKSSGTGLAK